MPLFKRGSKLTAFGGSLLETHERWCAEFQTSDGLEHPHLVALTSASAGAVPALGAFGTVLQEKFDNATDVVEAGPATMRDHIVEFAHALDDEQNAEAAYRVVTWALLAELSVFFWRPNYDLEMTQCASAFGMDSIFEQTVVALGRPVDEGATEEERGDRAYELIKGSLYGMVSAATGQVVEPEDPIVNLHVDNWTTQFFVGRKTAGERLEELAPEGLPIWED